MPIFFGVLVKYLVNQSIVEGDIIANSRHLCGEGLEVEKANKDKEKELVHSLGAQLRWASFLLVPTNWSDLVQLKKFGSLCV